MSTAELSPTRRAGQWRRFMSLTALEIIEQVRQQWGDSTANLVERYIAGGLDEVRE